MKHQTNKKDYEYIEKVYDKIVEDLIDNPLRQEAIKRKKAFEELEKFDKEFGG